jgi:hypothetical protein
VLANGVLFGDTVFFSAEENKTKALTTVLRGDKLKERV